MLTPAKKLRPDVVTRHAIPQDHGLELSLDRTVLVPAAQPAIHDLQPVTIESDIININRTVGTILSHEIAKVHGQARFARRYGSHQTQGLGRPKPGSLFGTWRDD